MINKAIILGRVGADPEIKNFQNGGQLVNLSVATSESWRDKNTGERREKTEWHKIAITNPGIVKLCQQHVRKGMKIYLEGAIQTRKWEDQSGQTRYATEIVVAPFKGELKIIDWGDQKSGGNTYAKPKTEEKGGFETDWSADFNDEIPFN